MGIALKVDKIKSKYLCKPCFRRIDMLVKKRDVYELRTKYANTSKMISSQNRSQREHYTSKMKRLPNESPQCQRYQNKKIKTISPRNETVKTSLFQDSDTFTIPSNFNMAKIRLTMEMAMKKNNNKHHIVVCLILSLHSIIRSNLRGINYGKISLF